MFLRLLCHGRRLDNGLLVLCATFRSSLKGIGLLELWRLPRTRKTCGMEAGPQDLSEQQDRRNLEACHWGAPCEPRVLRHQISAWVRNKLPSGVSYCYFWVYVFWFCEDAGCCFYSESHVNLTEKASTLHVSLTTQFDCHLSQEVFLMSRQNTPFPDLTILILFLTILILILIPLNYTLPI